MLVQRNPRNLHRRALLLLLHHHCRHERPRRQISFGTTLLGRYLTGRTSSLLRRTPVEVHLLVAPSVPKSDPTDHILDASYRHSKPEIQMQMSEPISVTTTVVFFYRTNRYFEIFKRTNLVSFGNFLERFFCIRTGVLVGMEFIGEFVVRLFDVLGRCVFGDSKHFVVILSTETRRGMEEADAPQTEVTLLLLLR
jgi:hypothetical protein